MKALPRIAAAIVGRSCRIAAVLLTIAVVNFFLIRLAPGDPATVMAGESAASDAQYVLQLRQHFGLDQPVSVQLLIYLGNLLRLDLGWSYRDQAPVIELIASRLPATAMLMLTGFLSAVLAGAAIGTFAAMRRRSVLDRILAAGSIILYSLPSYWLAIVLVLLFSVLIPILPGFGMMKIGAGEGGLSRMFDIAAHLVLPAVALGSSYFAMWTQYTRATVLTVAQEDYVHAARAMGLPEGMILWRYVVRNALVPLISLAGVQAGSLVGGALLVENVFAWPGIGRLAFDAVTHRDYNLLLGVFLACGALAILVNLVTDLVHGLLDPHIHGA
jgi:peptide/nickel transport system permease protein